MNAGDDSVLALSSDGRITVAEFIASPNCDARPPDTVIDALIIHAISLPPGCYGGGDVARLFTNCLDADAHPAFVDDDAFSDAQYDSLAALARLLMRAYPSITTANIAGHNDIAPTRKTDPGPYFDWPRLRAMLADESTITVTAVTHPPRA